MAEELEIHQFFVAEEGDSHGGGKGRERARLKKKSNLRPGNLLRFSVRDESVKLVDGKMEIGELQFAGKLNRSCTFADRHSKDLFRYAARHAPLRIEDMVASVQSNSMELESTDVEMQD